MTKGDLSGLLNDQHYISEVRQKAFVEVDEQGTEAAAVTAIEIPAGEMMDVNPPPQFEMLVDRPFLFVIVDARSEMILFMGLINGL